MIFALSDTVGLAVIAAVNGITLAVISIFAMVVKEFLIDRPRAREAAKLVATVAVNVADNAIIQGEKLDKLHEATNGLVEVLGAAREAKGRAEAEAEAKAKAKDKPAG